MKKIFTIAIIALSINAFAQSTVCFNIPDGTDGSSWSYKDYIIPSGFKIDSVYMDATRTGYATSDYDFVFAYCPGVTAYNSSLATYPFSYTTVTTSLYNIWIDLTSDNIQATGMVRVSLPTNAGATWNDLCFAISPISTITTCYNTPDGTDGSSWSYKDYVIPSGFKIDSVYMDATRPGYATSDYDFVFAYCPGVTAYNSSLATYPFSYTTVTTSLYNIWIDLTSDNIQATGMVRVSLPTNAGATWNDLCFAISPLTTTGLNENVSYKNSFIYPNPSTDKINLNTAEIVDIRIYNFSGQVVKSIPNNSGTLDISDLNSGIYFLQITNKNSTVSSIYKFVKN